MRRLMPILDWGARYDKGALGDDLLAAVIVTIMLIPQSLAYALLAGLPAQMGLYASIAPLIAYALFGGSSALAVGPVAVVSLMTAAAIGALELSDPAAIMGAAITLAFLSGLILLAMGALRLGFLAGFLSHPVIAGFITASGILIAASQVKHLLGAPASGRTLPDILTALRAGLGQTNWPTLAIGLPALAFLFWVRTGLKPLLLKRGVAPRLADVAAKAGPIAVVAASILLVRVFRLDEAGVTIVGAVPQGLPPLTLPRFNADLWLNLLGPAALISLIGFVESVSVAQTLAAKRRETIIPDQELVGLGAANVASALTGGYPVTGGFARSVVNFDAGARTPAAGAYTALGIAIATLLLTPLLHFLPTAALAATIIVAVLSLVDFTILGRAWTYSRADFATVAATILITLGFGVEAGVSAGVGLSILLFLWRTARPHVAEVGLVEGTEHFRNIHRHAVTTDASVLTLRIDESLYFANARHLEELILNRVAACPGLRHVVLMCSAVNDIDLSALETLEALDQRLGDMGVTLNLSEVKGPVTDKLKRTHFLDHLSGEVFLSQHQAFDRLRGQASKREAPGGRLRP